MEISRLHELFLKSAGVSTDTRKIKKESIFFALKGANFNANEFTQEALRKGASYAVVDEEEYAISEQTILVPEVLKALQELSNFHRNYLGIPIVALTGSNGKTTTKELINAVLSTKFKTTATKGNFNNHIGVPLTLLSMNKETEIGIVEMGANHHKEIAALCTIAEPDFGYITNFGKAHLEGFGSLEGVKKAKGELYDFLKQENGLIFINSDDETQQNQLSYSRIFTFGKEKNVDVQYKILKPDPFVQIEYDNQIIKSQLIGSYNASNIAAALAMGLFFKIEKGKIAEAIEKYVPGNNRSQIIRKGSNTVILDAYNANPTSMLAALESFQQLPAKNKMVILGDMFEIGSSAMEEHQNIANSLTEMDLEKAFLIGDNFSRVKISGSKIQRFKTIEELKQYFILENLSETSVLIKGSRGMALERLLKSD